MKKTSALLTLLVATICSLTSSIRSAEAAPAQQFDASSSTNANFFSESDLKPGQTGYALTVFKGSTVSRFGVEILGVLHGMNNGHDFIVIKVTSGPSVTDNLNIAEGMSGSPVYIHHKLVGAIAASFPFGTSPIGFVTPIGDMLDAWDPNLPSKPNISLSSVMADGSSQSLVDSSSLDELLGRNSIAFNPQETAGVRPLQTPVMVSGMSQEGISRLAGILGPYGMTPVAGGGMGSRHTEMVTKGSDQLVPGAALGCSLVQGDFDYTAIGTVTYRDKNRLIAFGHPFLGLGALDAPLTTVNIVTMFPSYETSMKLGEPLANVGRVFQDRPFSIGGELGVAPHMVPMTVNVIDHTNKRHRRYHFDIINHPLLTGQFVVLVAQQAILETHGSPGDAIATVTTTVNADQVGRITRSNVFYDSLSIEQTATNDLDSLVRLLGSNSFYPLSIKGVDMQVTIDSSHATAQVDHIFVPKTKYKPGDTVNVGVVIKPYKEDPILKTVSLKIPSSTPDGSVTLTVRGGGVSDDQTLSLGGETIVLHTPGSQQGPTPANVNQLVRQYLDEAKNNDLVSTLQLPTTAVAVQGENLSLLPPTMSGVMRSSRSTGVHTARDQVKETAPTQFVLTGSQTITLTVTRSSDLDTSTLSTPPPPSSPDVTSDTDDDSSAPDTSQSVPSSSDSVINRIQAAPAQFGSDLTPLVATSSMPALPPPPPGTASVKTGVDTDVDATVSTSSTEDATSTPATQTVVGRQAQVWRQDSSSDFSEGTLDNTSVTSANDLRLSLSLKQLSQSTSSYIWSLAQDNSGNLYAGTGDDGIVYRIDSSGQMKSFYRTGELEVTSLTYVPSTDTLYAGTSPHGAVFAISSKGIGRRLGSVGDKYVTALAFDPSLSRLYAATGGGTGDVYDFDLNGTGNPKVFFSSPETHLLSLAIDSKGTVYSGGAPDGVIYGIAPDGTGNVVYDSAQPNITALAVDSKDDLYAATSPAGLIYKISPADSLSDPRDVKLLSARPKTGVSGLGVDSQGNVWASAGDSVYCVSADDTTYTYTAPTDVILLSLLSGNDGHIYVGTGNTASIYRLGAGQPGLASAYVGSYVSPVHDAKRPSRWGTIAWNDVTPPGTSVTLQTRTGDVPDPDQTWSDWSPSYSDSAGQKIVSPSARFIQYKATLQSSNRQDWTSALPRLDAVSIYYLTRSQAPIVTVTSPSEGAYLNGTSILHWSALDADHDTLSYDVYYSTDGKNYLPMPKSSTTTAPASPDVTAKLKMELDRHPEIPAGVRQQMLQQASPVVPVGITASHVTTNSYSWDTKTVPDGTYQIKVVASNIQSDPSDPKTGEGYSQQFVIVNTPPVVGLNAMATKVQADGSVKMSGTATSNIAFVKAVQFQIDKSKDLYSAVADGGIFDSTSIPYTISTSPLTSGPHSITITAFDLAGNSSSTTTTVVVP